jgi:Flp pilus assembly pilin Flp
MPIERNATCGSELGATSLESAMCIALIALMTIASLSQVGQSLSNGKFRQTAQTLDPNSLGGFGGSAAGSNGHDSPGNSSGGGGGGGGATP